MDWPFGTRGFPGILPVLFLSTRERAAYRAQPYAVFRHKQAL